MNKEEFLLIASLITDGIEREPESILSMNIIDAANIVILFAIQGKHEQYLKFSKELGEKHGKMKFIVVLAKMSEFQNRIGQCQDDEQFEKLLLEFEEIKQSYSEQQDYQMDALSSILNDNGILPPEK
jgi:type VI protein secretion system component Hcp